MWGITLVYDTIMRNFRDFFSLQRSFKVFFLYPRAIFCHSPLLFPLLLSIFVRSPTIFFCLHPLRRSCMSLASNTVKAEWKLARILQHLLTVQHFWICIQHQKVKRGGVAHCLFFSARSLALLSSYTLSLVLYRGVHSLPSWCWLWQLIVPACIICTKRQRVGSFGV